MSLPSCLRKWELLDVFNPFMVTSGPGDVSDNTCNVLIRKKSSVIVHNVSDCVGYIFLIENF